MKKLLGMVFVSVCTQLFGLPIAWEPFAYPLSQPAPIYTNLVGQTNPDGFTWSQAGPTTGLTNVPYIYPDSLSYAGLAASSGNSVKFGGVDSGGMAARFSLKSQVTSGTIYFSCIIKITDITGLSSSGVFWAGFNNSAGSQGTLPSAVGTRVYTKASGGGYLLGVGKNSGTGVEWAWDTTARNVDEVIFLVGSYTFVGTVGSDDICSLWINPDAGTFGRNDMVPTATLTTSSGNDIPSGVINSFCIFNRNAAEPRGIILDQLTLGSSWADVTLTNVPIGITSQPRSQRAVAGGQASFSVSAFNGGTYQWRHNGSDIPGATKVSLTLSPVSLSDAGTYTVLVANGPASVLSSNATLTVFADTFPRLVPFWSLAPLSRPYLSIDSANQPNQRSIAYNALSNQVLLVTRTNLNYAYPTNAQVFVLNADTGADLYEMNNDPTIITGGLDIGGGTNLITLSSIDVAEDGAVYAANISTNLAGNLFNVYRWENSGTSAAPVKIWEDNPNSPGTIGPRWGNSMAVRGAGESTQILLVDQNGTLGSVLYPVAGQPLTHFPWNYGPFANAAGGISGGRTLLYYGAGSTFWEKHANVFNLVSYDYTTTFNSTVLTNYPISGSQVAFNANTNVLCVINVGSSSSAPDTLDQYDISDPSQPLFVRSYPFPTNHHDNGNGTGRVIFSGDRVYALDSNNGLAAWTLVPVLQLVTSGSDVVLSWSAATPGYTLKSTPSLTPPVTWTTVGSGTLVGNQYYVTNSIGTGGLFYRLQK